MTFTYVSTGGTDSVTRDVVRTYIGDVDSSDPLLTDEQIALAISEAGNATSAAALCADWISATFARKSDKTVGDLQIRYSQRFTQYRELASMLRRGVALTALPYAGGISISDKATREADADRVEPAFEVDMLDNTSASAFSITEN